MASLEMIGQILEAEIRKEADKLAAKVSNHAFNFIRTAVLTTPVDTSRALSNWRVSILNYEAGQIEPYVEGSKGSTAEQSSAVAISLADAKLRDREFGNVVYIVNHTEYILDLNMGASAQAKAGFIDDLIEQLAVNLSTL